MIWIRTIKNNYDIDVIIDATDDEQFVNTSGLEWSLISDVDTLPENGSYYYDEMIIPFGSDDYDNVIVPVINGIEEPLKNEREKVEEENLKILLEELESQRLAKEENQSLLDKIVDNPPNPTDEEQINQLTDIGMIDPRTLPRPKVTPIDGVESTKENFEIWHKMYLNTSSLVDSLSSKQYNDIVENVVIFDPPHKFPDGVEQSHFPFPEDTVDEYLDYLIQMRDMNKNLLDTICNDLGLPLIER